MCAGKNSIFDPNPNSLHWTLPPTWQTESMAIFSCIT